MKEFVKSPPVEWLEDHDRFDAFHRNEYPIPLFLLKWDWYSNAINPYDPRVDEDYDDDNNWKWHDAASWPVDKTEYVIRYTPDIDGALGIETIVPTVTLYMTP